MTPGDMLVDVEYQPDHAVVVLEGDLRSSTKLDVRVTLAKTLADQPQVIVDLGRVRLTWQAAVEVFPSVLVAAGGWPTGCLVLYNASRRMANALHAARVTRTVPLVADRDAAAVQVHERPPRVARELSLPSLPTSPDAARAAVREACGSWGVAEPSTRAAATVAGELVANAVAHARTRCALRIALDEKGLWISVRDDGPGGSGRRRNKQAGASTGRGLQVVDLLARHWGVSPRAVGKSVWALIATDG